MGKEPPNETLSVIDSRSSLRGYDSKPLSDEDKNWIVHSAIRAPTAGNMLHYSMIEVSDQDKKHQLVKTCDNQPFIAKAPFVLLFLADLQRWYDYFEYAEVLGFCETNDIEYVTPQESDLLLACCDALVAAQNAVIAAESLGIGSCYIGDIMENIEIHREMFNLPKWVFPIALVCFGHRRREDQNRRTSRFPRRFVYFENEYQPVQAEEFDEMLGEHFGKRDSYPGNAQNMGQAIYWRKTGSDYAAEMRRSVKVALRDWISK